MITDTYTVLKSYTDMYEWVEIICLQEQRKLFAFPFMSTTVCDNISYTSIVGMY